MSTFEQNKLLELQLDNDSIHNESQICEQKLKSKCDALRIMTTTLDQTRQQRDQFKLMAEQVQHRCQMLKRQLSGSRLNLTEMNYNFVDELPQSSNYNRDISFMDDSHKAILVGDLIQRNKALQFTVCDLQQKLADANGDIQLLREKSKRESVVNDLTPDCQLKHCCRSISVEDKAALVEKLEASTDRCKTLERDIEGLLEEKEEREVDKDCLRDKFDKLNQQLNLVLNGDDNRIIDINALTTDNKYLHEKLESLEKEKSIALSNVSKYKGLLDRHKSHGILKNGELRPKSSTSGVIVTPKQVNEILKHHGNNSLSKTTDLHTLAQALLDSLNDKSMVITHQRKANRMLASRVSDLESTLQSLQATNHLDCEKNALLSRLCLECREITDELHQKSPPAPTSPLPLSPPQSQTQTPPPPQKEADQNTVFTFQHIPSPSEVLKEKDYENDEKSAPVIPNLI